MASGKASVSSNENHSPLNASGKSRIVAAIAAAVLALLANLENFSNALERAQAYRESRELFLDAAREFERSWRMAVDPFYPDPEACVNAAELYRVGAPDSPWKADH